MLEKYDSIAHTQPWPWRELQHGPLLQAVLSELGPSHALPPLLALGLLHERDRVRVPGPQPALQPPNPPQLPHRPFTLGRRLCPAAHAACCVTHWLAAQLSFPLEWQKPFVVSEHVKKRSATTQQFGLPPKRSLQLMHRPASFSTGSCWQVQRFPAPGQQCVLHVRSC